MLCRRVHVDATGSTLEAARSQAVLAPLSENVPSSERRELRVRVDSAEVVRTDSQLVRRGRILNRGFLAVFVGLLAAIAYSSWPVAYLVNPSLAATALASELEESGQPYSWLFVLLDCVTGVAALIVVRLAWPEKDSAERRLLVLALIGYALFGLATAVDALIPVSCGSVPIHSCGLDVRHLSADDYLTAFAVFALFVGICGAQIRAARLLAWNLLSVASLVIALGWSVAGPIFLAVSMASRPAISMQHGMLSLTSAVAFLVPALSLVSRSRGRTARGRPPREPEPTG